MRRRMKSTSGIIVTRQNKPTAIWVARQPDVVMKCCNTGGQIVPAT